MSNRPTYYSNSIAVQFGEHELILDLRLKGATGRPSELCRLILPPDVAAKLAALLMPDTKGSINGNQQPDA